MSIRPHFSLVCGKSKVARLDVVFIHGLTGDPLKTWSSSDTDDFWPCWLLDEFQDVCVYTAGYPSSLFEKWAKKEMDLHERASNLLEHLVSNGIGKRPVALVCHSLGGILAKEILRSASESQDEDWQKIAKQLKLTVFIATPHKGAALARALKFALPRLTTKTIDALSGDSGFLANLNNAYRDLTVKRDIQTVSYYEKFKTKDAVLVVSAESADPGVGQSRPIAIDADHSSICKPKNRKALLFISLKRHINRTLERCPLIQTTDPYLVVNDEQNTTGKKRSPLPEFAGSVNEFKPALKSPKSLEEPHRSSWFIHDLKMDDLPAPLVEVEPVIRRKALLEHLNDLIDRNTVAPVKGPPRSGKSCLIRGFVGALKDGQQAQNFSILFVDMEAKRPSRAFLRSAGYRGKRTLAKDHINQSWDDQDQFTNQSEIDDLLSFDLPYLVRSKMLIVVIQRFSSILKDETALDELNYIFRSEALRHAFVIAEVGEADAKFENLRVAPAIQVGFLKNVEIVDVLVERGIPKKTSEQVSQYLQDDPGLRIAGYLTAAAALHPAALQSKQGAPTASTIVDDILEQASLMASTIVTKILAVDPEQEHSIVAFLQAYALVSSIPYDNTYFQVEASSAPAVLTLTQYGLLDVESGTFCDYFRDALRASLSITLKTKPDLSTQIEKHVLRIVELAKKRLLNKDIVVDSLEGAVLWLLRFAPNAQGIRLSLSKELLIDESATKSISPINPEDKAALAKVLKDSIESGDKSASVQLVILLAQSDFKEMGWSEKGVFDLIESALDRVSTSTPLSVVIFAALCRALWALQYSLETRIGALVSARRSFRTKLLNHRALKGNTDLPWCKVWLEWSLDDARAEAFVGNQFNAEKIIEECGEYLSTLKASRAVAGQLDWHWDIEKAINAVRLQLSDSIEERQNLLTRAVTVANENLKDQPFEFDNFRLLIRLVTELVRELPEQDRRSETVDNCIVFLTGVLGETESWTRNMRAMAASLMRVESRNADSENIKIGRAQAGLDLIYSGEHADQIRIVDPDIKSYLVETRLLLLADRREDARVLCQKIVDDHPSAESWSLLLKIVDERKCLDIEPDYLNTWELISPLLREKIRDFENWARDQSDTKVQSVRLWCLRRKWSADGSIISAARRKLEHENRSFGRLPKDRKLEILTRLYTKRVSAINNILRQARTLEAAVIAKANNEAQFQRSVALIRRTDMDDNPVLSIYADQIKKKPSANLFIHRARFYRYVWNLKLAIEDYSRAIVLSLDCEMLRVARFEMANCLLLAASNLSDESVSDLERGSRLDILRNAKGIVEDLVGHSDVAVSAAVTKDLIAVELREEVDWESIDSIFSKVFGDIVGFPNVFVENASNLINNSPDALHGIVDVLARELLDVNVMVNLGKCYLREAELCGDAGALERTQKALTIFNACSLLERSWVGSESVVTSYYRARSIIFSVRLTRSVNPIRNADLEGKKDLLSLGVSRLNSVFDRTLGEFKKEVRELMRNAEELRADISHGMRRHHT